MSNISATQTGQGWDVDEQTGAPISGGAGLATGHRIALVGDSRHFDASTDVLRITKSNPNWVVQLMQLLGQPGRIEYFGGISGARTDQITQNVAAAAANDDVTDVFLIAAVNDIITAYPTAQTSGATAAANMMRHIQTLRAAGKRVWVEEELGADASYSGRAWTAANAVQAGIYNETIERFCNETKTGVVFLRFGSALLDRTQATNTFIAGATYDGLHYSPGGALLKAQHFLRNHPSAFPLGSYYVNPASDAYSGDPSKPVQVLENPGFAVRTGGTAAAGGATFSAWAGATVVAAKAFRTNGGRLYYTKGGGTTGATAPTHTSGAVSDGGVMWEHIMSATPTVPQKWAVGRTGAATYLCGTNVTAENQIEMVVVAVFSATPLDAVYVRSGFDTASPAASFYDRLAMGGQYSMQVKVQIDDHVNLGAVNMRWLRGDMTNYPQDGAAFTDTLIDTKGAYSGGLGSYPLIRTLATTPFTADATSTANGGSLSAVAIWQNFDLQIQGVNTGFAIVRIRDARMVRTN